MEKAVGITSVSAEVFKASVFRCVTNGTYFAVEGTNGSKVVIRRAPTGAKRTVSLAKFLRDYIWVGSKAILSQMRTA